MEPLSLWSETGEQKLILVVDDEPRMVRFVRMNLELEGYQVTEAGNGIEALEKVRDDLPDLILLDNVMPGMSGVEACKLLKADEKTRGIPVLFVTAMDDKHNESVGLQSGAVDYINKPPSPEIVLARVKVHLQSTVHRRFIQGVADGSLSGDEAVEAAKELLA